MSIAKLIEIHVEYQIMLDAGVPLEDIEKIVSINELDKQSANTDIDSN